MFSFRRLFTPTSLGGSEPKTPEPRVSFRAMVAGDLLAVQAIEEASHPNAWSQEDLRRWMTGARVSAHVLEVGLEVRAFFVVQREEHGLHLVNIAVAPAHRRRGHARQSLAAIENIARAFGLPRVVLEVRESNLPAQLLYRSVGYRAVEILRAHYGDEDGYRMAKPVPRLPGRGST
jgi:ribosomal-protein-alanine N-acetyltransferase